MNTDHPWLRKAQGELSGLLAGERTRPLPPADAYRALVLLARLRQAPEAVGVATHTVPAEVIQGLAARCTLPDGEDLLAALDGAFGSESEPAGELLDALLDVDDLTGVLGLLGRDADARVVSAQAAAITSLHPERVTPLVPWSDDRLASLRPDAPTAAVWLAIRHAPAELIAPMLPAPDEIPPGAHRTLERLRRSARVVRIPLPDLPRLAARSGGGESFALHDAEGRPAGDCYVDPGTGQRVIELRLPPGDTSKQRVWLHVLDRGSGRSLGREELVVARDGRDLYISLGDDAGAESARHRLAACAGVRLDDVDLELRFDDE